jgi:hypothetical protein
VVRTWSLFDPSAGGPRALAPANFDVREKDLHASAMRELLCCNIRFDNGPLRTDCQPRPGYSAFIVGLKDSQTRDLICQGCAFGQPANQAFGMAKDGSPLPHVSHVVDGHGSPDAGPRMPVDKLQSAANEHLGIMNRLGCRVLPPILPPSCARRLRNCRTTRSLRRLLPTTQRYQSPENEVPYLG